MKHVLIAVALAAAGFAAVVAHAAEPPPAVVETVTVTNDPVSMTAHNRRSGMGVWLAAPFSAKEAEMASRHCVGFLAREFGMVGHARVLGLGKLPGAGPLVLCVSEAPPLERVRGAGVSGGGQGGGRRGRPPRHLRHRTSA